MTATSAEAACKPFEAGLGIADGQMDADSGMARPKGCDQRNRQIRCVGYHGQGAGFQGRRLGQQGGGLTLGLEDRPDGRQQPAPEFGRFDRSAAPVEQHAAIIPFQSPDLVGDRGLGQSQRRGGGGKAAMGRHRLHRPQLHVLHAAIHQLNR
nr:hypothetical protein [Gluconacetobacter sacchari]